MREMWLSRYTHELRCVRWHPGLVYLRLKVHRMRHRDTMDDVPEVRASLGSLKLSHQQAV
jgi:hypothetical protein